MSNDQSCATWSDLNHDVLNRVMMQLGVVEFVSLSGVCKSWRSFALSNRDTFMASTPPMSVTIISTDNNKKACYLEDFEGRKIKTILPDFTGGDCMGLTCGYLVFFMRETREFRLVNPITRHQLHFPDYPAACYRPDRAILVFLSSISKWAFVVVSQYCYEIWFCIAGERAWNHVSYRHRIRDLHASKGKIYARTSPFNLLELRLDASQPKLMPLEIKKPDCAYLDEFVSSGERLYVIGRDRDFRDYLLELDLVEMKWVKVKACEKTMEEYAFFRSDMNYDLWEMKWVKPCEETVKEYAFFSSDSNRDVVAVKRESWADPRSWSHGRFAYTNSTGIFRVNIAKMWYFPHECLNVDLIDE